MGGTPPPPPPPPPPGGYAPPPPPPGAGYTAPGHGGAPFGGATLAEWPLRAQSALIDWFAPTLVANFVYYTISSALGLLLMLAAWGWSLYNAYLNGSTGQSFGKQQAGTRVLSEATGQPIGGGLGIVRGLAHIVDAIICYIGFLFPLWDSKKQTLADKIMKTVVVKV